MCNYAQNTNALTFPYGSVISNVLCSRVHPHITHEVEDRTVNIRSVGARNYLENRINYTPHESLHEQQHQDVD